MSSRIISVDFETYYSKKEKYGISELGAWKYCDDARFDPYLIAVSDGSESWAGEPQDFCWESLEGATLLSHNRAFDSCVYEAMVRKGMAPRVNIKDWLCTANMTAYLCNRRSLKDSSEFLLGVKLSKATRDYAKEKHAADMRRDGKWEEMLGYGRSDAKHCHDLFTRYGHLWPDHERRLSELTIGQGSRGIAIDIPLLQEYIKIASEMLQATEAVLPWMADGRAPTSPKAIAEECRKVGIPCPPVKSHFEDGEARFAVWENTYGPKYDWIANVSNWRSINKFLESLHTIAERLMPDGCFSFGLKYFGAHTGRWSGDSGFNMQNLRKVPIYCDDRRLMISDDARLKEIGKCKKGPLPGYVSAVLDIRKLFIARSGRRLILSDLSQIEPRVLAWLVGDEKMLELMRAGKSPYQSHAEATMGWIRGDMKALNEQGDGESQALYALAKARVLGLGFGCGPEKFITVAQTMAGLDITKDDPQFIHATDKEGEPIFDKEGQPVLVSGRGFHSRRVVKEYRESNPKVVALWKKLDQGFKNSEGGDFKVELPSGREMRYGKVRRECRSVLDEETGTVSKKWIFTADIGGRRFPLYGGLLTENLVQATARDVFAEQVLKLDTEFGSCNRVLFTSHDEAINEANDNVSKKDVEHIMSQAPEWMPGLPVACEAKESAHYLK